MLERSKYGMLWGVTKPRTSSSNRRSLKPAREIDSDTKQTEHPTPEEIRRVMSALGRIGGPKGGKARAKKLSAKRRRDIAKRAASARWSSDESK